MLAEDVAEDVEEPQQLSIAAIIKQLEEIQEGGRGQRCKLKSSRYDNDFEAY